MMVDQLDPSQPAKPLLDTAWTILEAANDLRDVVPFILQRPHDTGLAVSVDDGLARPTMVDRERPSDLPLDQAVPRRVATARKT